MIDLDRFEHLPRLFWETTLGVYYLHGQGILHCNINASNIFITENGHAKLGDFSSSCHVTKNDNDAIVVIGYVDNGEEVEEDEKKNTTIRSQVSNSQSILPPECLVNNKYAWTFASDIYCLGITFLQILSKQLMNKV